MLSESTLICISGTLDNYIFLFFISKRFKEKDNILMSLIRVFNPHAQEPLHVFYFKGENFSFSD